MREACKETRTSDHSQEKKKLPEILLKEEQILKLLENDFKSTLKYAQKYKHNHGQNVWPYAYVLSRSYVLKFQILQEYL